MSLPRGNKTKLPSVNKNKKSQAKDSLQVQDPSKDSITFLLKMMGKSPSYPKRILATGRPQEKGDDNEPIDAKPIQKQIDSPVENSRLLFKRSLQQGLENKKLNSVSLENSNRNILSTLNKFQAWLLSHKMKITPYGFHTYFLFSLNHIFELNNMEEDLKEIKKSLIDNKDNNITPEEFNMLQKKGMIQYLAILVYVIKSVEHFIQICPNTRASILLEDFIHFEKICSQKIEETCSNLIKGKRNIYALNTELGKVSRDFREKDLSIPLSPNINTPKPTPYNPHRLLAYSDLAEQTTSFKFPRIKK